MYMEGEAVSGLEGSGLYLLIAFGLLLLFSWLPHFLLPVLPPGPGPKMQTIFHK